MSANLPIFKQRLPGLCTAWRPFCDPCPDAHFGDRDAWLNGRVREARSRVAIWGVAKRSVLRQPYSSSTSVQEV